MIDHPQILRDAILNQRLFDDGYVVLSLLKEEEVQNLTALFYQYHSDNEVVGLYVSSSQKKKDEAIQISDAIQSAFSRAMDEVVLNGQTLGGTFITKAPNQTEQLEPHQDWSIVDESRFRSYTIWAPLRDVDENSGCLFVLPKSHEILRGYRHVTIPSIFGQIYENVWEQMIPIRLKAGEAIIFDQALGHASKPNLSPHVRIAATHSLMSTDAEMRFYCNNNGTVEEYAGEADYYNTEEAKVGPGRLKKLRDVNFQMEQLTIPKFDSLFGLPPSVPQAPIVEQPLPIKKPSLIESIKAYFN